MVAEMLPLPRKEKSVLLHTEKAGPGLGAQTIPRDGAHGVVCSHCLWGLL